MRNIALIIHLYRKKKLTLDDVRELYGPPDMEDREIMTWKFDNGGEVVYSAQEESVSIMCELWDGL